MGSVVLSPEEYKLSVDSCTFSEGSSLFQMCGIKDMKGSLCTWKVLEAYPENCIAYVVSIFPRYIDGKQLVKSLGEVTRQIGDWKSHVCSKATSYKEL